jgi:predicted nucleic acid-binding protein
MEAASPNSATLTSFEIRVLSLPGWHPRLWLAVTIAAALTTLPLIIAGPVLWVASMQFVMLAESLSRVLGEHRRVQRRADIALERNAALLAERDAQIASLAAELASARSNSGARRETDEERTYRQVGLHPGAPDFLVAAARRAYRVALHPDRHLQRHHQQAHQRYLQAEAVFERIAELRR